jgi:hypothetical protein
LKLIVTEQAAGYLRSHNSRIYVWPQRRRCCGGGHVLETSVEAPGGRDFTSVENSAGIDLFLPTHLGRLPNELQLDLQRLPRRIRAYWDGCVWVV